MPQDYISYIRSKVGQDKIFLNFAAGILCDEEGGVLLQLRGDSQKWGVIGGIMELGESSSDTVVREFLEETGIAVEPVKLLNVYTNFETVFPNGDEAQTVGVLYQVRATESFSIDHFANEETLQLAFFSAEEIAHLELFSPQQKVMLDEYFSGQFQVGR
ncbi:NUDIX hydrolase [Streptococcus pluranimalium]|uniref:NUDIX hydrolase n=1 Tax=Streptococcus hyovaginalis TaxID=149015 RepID=UPI0003FCF81A|nr:NUDIX domain-containing protein [Streptococcus hyovaginalis]MDY4510337.1 NUDIX domain-containing protein [Streptococcus hyovaginalis]